MTTRPARRARALTRPRDAGEVVTAWLVKLVVVFGILGIAGFDVVSIVSATFRADDAADSAANAAETSWTQNHDVRAAFASAQASAAGDDVTVDERSFVISPTGTVSLTVRTTAHTLVVAHVGPLRHLAVVTGAGSHGTGSL